MKCKDCIFEVDSVCINPQSDWCDMKLFPEYDGCEDGRKSITIEDCRNLKNKFERYCETAEQYEFIPLTILQMKLDKTLEIIEKDGAIKDQKEARAMFQTILLVIGENADDYKEVANT